MEAVDCRIVSVEKRPIRLLSFPLDAKFYKTRARVRIDKAKRLLGYKPAFDLEAGMKRTEEWARWANLLDAPNPVLLRKKLFKSGCTRINQVHHQFYDMNHIDTRVWNG